MIDTMIFFFLYDLLQESCVLLDSRSREANDAVKGQVTSVPWYNNLNLYDYILIVSSIMIAVCTLFFIRTFVCLPYYVRRRQRRGELQPLAQSLITPTRGSRSISEARVFQSTSFNR